MKKLLTGLVLSLGMASVELGAYEYCRPVAALTGLVLSLGIARGEINTYEAYEYCESATTSAAAFIGRWAMWAVTGNHQVPSKSREKVFSVQPPIIDVVAVAKKFPLFQRERKLSKYCVDLQQRCETLQVQLSSDFSLAKAIEAIPLLVGHYGQVAQANVPTPLTGNKGYEVLKHAYQSCRPFLQDSALAVSAHTLMSSIFFHLDGLRNDRGPARRNLAMKYAQAVRDLQVSYGKNVVAEYMRLRTRLPADLANSMKRLEMANVQLRQIREELSKSVSSK